MKFMGNVGRPRQNITYYDVINNFVEKKKIFTSFLGIYPNANKRIESRKVD